MFIQLLLLLEQICRRIDKRIQPALAQHLDQTSGTAALHSGESLRVLPEGKVASDESNVLI